MMCPVVSRVVLRSSLLLLCFGLTLTACAHSRTKAAAATPARRPAGGDARVPNEIEGALLAAKHLIVPVEGIDPARLRDSYDAPRGEHVHSAVDILAPRGTPVLSADSGRVFRLRRNPAGGITVYALDPEEQFIYYYAHLERYRDGLAEGMILAQGDVLGYVGTTGNAPPNTPHLHFQMMRYRGDGKWWGLEPINPLPWLGKAGVRHQR